MASKTISEQIIEFAKANFEVLNTETFSTLEFVIQAGRLDGCRVKKYIKNKSKNGDGK